MVEVGDLLAQVVVLEQGRPARARAQRVVGVAQPGAGGRGEEGALLAHRRWGRRPRLGAGGRDRRRRLLLGLGRQRVVGSRRLLEGDRCEGRGTGRRRGAAGRLGRLGRLAEVVADFEGLGDFAAGLMGLAYPGRRRSMHPRRRVCSTPHRVGHRFRQRTEDATPGGSRMRTTTERPTAALITGASSGIGRATALLLAREGLHVVLTGRAPRRAEAARRGDPRGGRDGLGRGARRARRRRRCSGSWRRRPTSSVAGWRSCTPPPSWPTATSRRFRTT